jgi:hypothetical protein
MGLAGNPKKLVVINHKDIGRFPLPNMILPSLTINPDDVVLPSAVCWIL